MKSLGCIQLRLLIPFLILTGCKKDNPFSVFGNSEYDVQVEITGDSYVPYEFYLTDGVPIFDTQSYESHFWFDAVNYIRSDTSNKSNSTFQSNIELSCNWLCGTVYQRTTSFKLYSINFHRIQNGTYTIGNYNDEWIDDVNTSPTMYLEVIHNEQFRGERKFRRYLSSNGKIRLNKLNTGEYEIYLKANANTEEETKSVSINAKLILFNE